MNGEYRLDFIRTAIEAEIAKRPAGRAERRSAARPPLAGMFSGPNRKGRRLARSHASGDTATAFAIPPVPARHAYALSRGSSAMRPQCRLPEWTWRLGVGTAFLSVEPQSGPAAATSPPAERWQVVLWSLCPGIKHHYLRAAARHGSIATCPTAILLAPPTASPGRRTGIEVPSMSSGDPPMATTGRPRPREATSSGSSAAR
jgi:hypothetical protein